MTQVLHKLECHILLQNSNSKGKHQNKKIITRQIHKTNASLRSSGKIERWQ